MLEKAFGLFDQLVAKRRDFHQHSELGYQEARTPNMIAETLFRFGYQIKRTIGRK